MTKTVNKIRVAILYGGRSGEHEISLISAASVIRNLDRARYDIVPISIDKQGKWRLQDVAPLIEAAQKVGSSLPLLKDAPQIVTLPYPSNEHLAPLYGSGSWGMDVVFPVMHGPLGEDGTVQGLLELAEVAYVGSGVLGSAIGMDKDVAKRLAQSAGIPVVPWIALNKGQYEADPEMWGRRIANELGFPCFAKPSNMGSSVGVHKVKDPGSLHEALRDAFKYDLKVLVERGVDAREIEVAVLESPEYGRPALASVAGEIIPKHEFYSYDAKYVDQNGADLKIPAGLSAAQLKEVQSLAVRTFAALECEGMARVDFFLDRNDGKFYLNEINTIPGFTQISMYPKMWEASGVSYAELLTKLIDLALARQERKKKLLREYAR